MRELLLITLINFTAVPALADVVIDPHGPWPERINTCVDVWYGATAAQQGTMTYRQFTTKCVGGRTALPIETHAVCEDGSTSTGHARDGACAGNGGVTQWLN